MIKRVELLIFLFLLLLIQGMCQTKMIDQKKGLYQDFPHKHAQFFNIKEFSINPKEAILATPVKIIKHQDKVYILDRKQCRIFVFNPQAEFLYTIGQPGQGPGDLEYPGDFYISSNEIFVINSGAKRVEVFSLDGKFENRIDLEVPKDNPFSYPRHILLGDNGKIYVSYNLNKILVDCYSAVGEYECALLERQEQIILPGINLGNSSHIQFADEGKAILHFNFFTGVFTKISLSGEIIAVFSAYDKIHKESQNQIIKNIRKPEKKIQALQIQVFELWADGFCVEETGEILALLLLKEKDAPQKIYVFSPEGLLKYFTQIEFFSNDPIKGMFFWEGQYFFITQQNKIFTAKRG